MSINKALQKLGYTSSWIEFGIISNEYLLSQYDEIQNSEDQNTEHYRCGGFSNYLNSKEYLTNIEIDNIFKLTDNGPDLCNLHIDRIHQLLYSDILNNEQLFSLIKYTEVSEPPIQKLYNRKCLLRKIELNGVDSSFDEIMKSNDPDIHRFILSLPDIKLHQIKWLSINSNNKKVRNIATQLSKNKKYRNNDT